MAGSMIGVVAIVTGSGRGIGKAVALAYAREGAAVILASRTFARVEDVATSIREQGGVALPIACDVGALEQVFATVNKAVSEFGTVHVLVNTAQSFGTAGAASRSHQFTAVEDLAADVVEHGFRTGALASLWGMQAVFPSMKAQHWGKIINFASASGVLGTPGNCPYNMTKEAIRALSKTAANEWGKFGINVNVICPTVLTDALREWGGDDPDFEYTSSETLPMRRLGDPERDVGPLAVFLATHGSDYITGQTFMLNGGKVML